VPSFRFFGGKGGTGKTTLAAMSAVQSGGRTLLVTTDPASSLGDVLKFRVRATPTPVGARGSLFAANVDAPRAFALWLRPRRSLFARIAVRGTYLDDEDVLRLLNLSLPGIDEVVGLLEVARLATGSGAGEAPYDHVIVDTAPTGHTLRLLEAPALLSRVAAVLDALQSHHRAVVSALRGSYMADASDAVIQELDRDGRELAGLLRNSGTTEVVWVTLPEPMALEETADAIAALETAGIRIARLIVNRVAPADRHGCDLCEARRRFESRALVPLARRFRDRQIETLPDQDQEPRGVPALVRAARTLTPFQPPRMSGPVEHRVRAKLPGAAEGAFDWNSLPGNARWLLFGGKGGVGKTTCAAAASLRLAETRRVLLLSVDPAHSLGDAFGASLDDRPQPVAGGPPTLHVRELDARREFERFRRRYIDAVDEAFGRIARTASLEETAFRDLIDLAPPGIDEVIAVAEVASALTSPDSGYDLVVTDTAPTGHALRLLHTPAILRDWTLALMTILRKYREIVGAGTLAELLVELSRRLRALQEILQDAARTRFVIVTRAAALPVEEARDLARALQSLRIAVGAIIVNALGGGDCGRCGRASHTEKAQLSHIRRLGAGRRYAIIGTPEEIPPPHGAAALASWSGAWQRIA
jgi:arsenite-transporting ATPase